MGISEYFVYCGISIAMNRGERAGQIAKGEFLKVPPQLCVAAVIFDCRAYENQLTGGVLNEAYLSAQSPSSFQGPRFP